MSDYNKAVVFLTGDAEYAIPIEFVISIEKPAEITPIPQFPSHVIGMAKIREDLVPLIDFENALYHRQSDWNNQDSKWILIKTENLAVALVVKEAKEIIEIPEESVKQIGLIAYQKTSFITGVANLPEKRLITVIDPHKLLYSLEGIKDLQAYMKDFVQS